MEWISVKSKEPPVAGPILVREGIYIDIVEWNPKGWFAQYSSTCCCCTGHCGFKFSHWMPLPEPPGTLPKRIVKEDYLESVEFCDGTSSQEFIKKRKDLKEAMQDLSEEHNGMD